MKLEYTGLKQDGETAFAELTGIARWFPGQIEEVAPKIAPKLLEHPMMWKVVEGAADVQLSAAKAAAGAAACTAPTPGPAAPATHEDTLPSWVRPGMAAGMTDEQLEAVAAEGGPTTETGAKLWLDFTGKGYAEPAGAAAPATTNAKPQGEFVVKKGGEWVVLDDMDLAALRAFAESVGVKIHAQAKEPKARETLLAAQPKKGWQ